MEYQGGTNLTLEDAIHLPQVLATHGTCNDYQNILVYMIFTPQKVNKTTMQWLLYTVYFSSMVNQFNLIFACVFVEVNFMFLKDQVHSTENKIVFPFFLDRLNFHIYSCRSLYKLHTPFHGSDNWALLYVIYIILGRWGAE